MIKIISIFSFITIFLTSVYSQKLIDQQCYKMKKGKCIPSSETYKLNDSTFLIKEYYKNGNPKMTIKNSKPDHNELNGFVRSYSKDGVLKSAGMYCKNVICGDWKIYGNNGTVIRQISYDKKPPRKTPDEDPESDLLENVVNKAPSFMGGGIDNFRKYISKELFYPPLAAEKGACGRIIVQFSVDKYGNVTDIQLKNKIDPDLGKEALRLLENSPKWTPGYKNGRPVKVQITLPILFIQ